MAVYSGHLQKGFAFLAKLAAERPERLVNDETGTDILEKAFSGPPNRYSLFALEAYLTNRCVTEAIGISTAVSIQQAFTHYWDKMGDGRWSGEYFGYQEDTGAIQGNPARATSLRALIKSIRSSGPSSRDQVEPLGRDAMKDLMDWSENQYPSEALQSLPKSDSESALALKHASGRAMFAFGFNIWVRNHELTKVRTGHIMRGCIDESNHPYIRILLPNTDPMRSDIPDSEGKVYKIFEQDMEEIDLYTHLLRYMDYVERTIGRPLATDDYLFPLISSGGTIYPDREMTHNMVQNLISEFTGDSVKRYTAHSLRRGGAQYRFVHAPLEQRWSLAAVRRAGGWVQNEFVGCLLFLCSLCARIDFRL
ncbi:hypothetical protein FPV67DRAFT_1421508 [Lyophyllum atratum]|nr:hypothetical protein FPV67DRAFT_1430135 [Lyophyllum atratum]KAF8063631.1 hypothetical protein FPV67DRAFT_1421508 [Lyophyllum atratum]